MSEITEKIAELTKVLWSDSATQDEKLLAKIEIGALMFAVSEQTKKEQQESLDAINLVNSLIRLANGFKNLR